MRYATPSAISVPHVQWRQVLRPHSTWEAQKEAEYSNGSANIHGGIAHCAMNTIIIKVATQARAVADVASMIVNSVVLWKMRADIIPAAGIADSDYTSAGVRG